MSRLVVVNLPGDRYGLVLDNTEVSSDDPRHAEYIKESFATLERLRASSAEWTLIFNHKIELAAFDGTVQDGVMDNDALPPG